MSNESQTYAHHEALTAVLEDCALGILPLLPRLSCVIKDREEDFPGPENFPWRPPAWPHP